MRAMELTRQEVVECLNPKLRETDYSARRKRRRGEPELSQYEAECRIATRGRLAVVYHPAKREVVTVLWRGEESRDAVRPSRPG